MTQFRKNSKYIKQMRAIAREHGCRLYFCKNFGDIANGTYYRLTRSVTIATEGRSLERILSTFCHEMAHHLCYENKIYTGYHFEKDLLRQLDSIGTAKLFDRFIKTGLKAERYVDRWGSRLIKDWFPGIRFQKAYATPARIKWFKERQIDPMRAHRSIARLMAAIQADEEREARGEKVDAKTITISMRENPEGMAVLMGSWE